MNTGFICGDDKYELMGVNNDVISLSVSFDNLPEEIKLDGFALYLPSPFHVSLLYLGRIIKEYNVSIPDFLNKIVEDFCDFTKTNEIKVTHYKDEYKFVTRGETEKTVIAMCEVSNLNNFVDFINKKYGLNIEHPTTHVTLYNIRKGEPGISLMNANDIKNLTKPILNPIGHPL